MLSVSQLNEYVRSLFQQDPLLRDIELKGELSNLKMHQSGMLFFTLKDEQASISCLMYASDCAMLQVEPFEGMRAVVSGSVGLYARGGQYQFYAKTLAAQGMGVLFERYLALKDQLSREGLFDPERKRALPAYVDTVGVVSSPTGAVIHDILHVSRRRDEHSSILLCPVRVQGAQAADEVVRAIGVLERMECVSVIILARGGGSMEDLWTFNEERVVRAVAACKKPIVSAIGHETDYTLCDFAADYRAPTPSAAAEAVIPLLRETREELQALRAALRSHACSALERYETSLELTRAQMNAAHSVTVLAKAQQALEQARCRLRETALEAVEANKRALEIQRHRINLLNPYGVLTRGYAIVMDGARVVTTAKGLCVGDTLTLAFADGQAQVRVIENPAQEQAKEE